MRLGVLERDVTKATQGTWVDLGDDFKVKVTRIGSPAYNDILDKELSQHRKNSNRSGRPIPGDIVDAAINKAFLATVLLDWQGLEDDNGTPIAFSREKALELFSDKRFAALRDIIISASTEEENFRAKDLADVVAK